MEKVALDGHFKIPIIGFEKAYFFGSGWNFSVMTGNDLPVDLTELDFNEVGFYICLDPGQSQITVEEKIALLKKFGNTLCGVKAFASLWHDYILQQDKAESALERIYKRRGITDIDFPGCVFGIPNGDRRLILRLSRSKGGRWTWAYHWFTEPCRGCNFSMVWR